MPCSCCAGESLDIFGERGARRELRRYLRDGLGGRPMPLTDLYRFPTVQTLARHLHALTSGAER